MSSNKEEMAPEVEKVEVGSEDEEEESESEGKTIDEVETQIIKYQVIGGAFILTSLVCATITTLNNSFPLEISMGLFGIGAVILAYFGFLTFKVSPEDYE